MDDKIHGIVLGIVKHSDRANVITLYTREQGRLAVVAPVGTGRAARMRAARLQLLSVVDAEVRRKNGRELMMLGQTSPGRIWRSIYFEPAKCGLVFFIAEFLNRFLREAPADPLMWDFIYRELERLDGEKNHVGNFHLQFLLGIMEIGGILPDPAGWEPGDWFDFRSGEFCGIGAYRIYGLPPEEASLCARLLKLGRQGIGRLRLGKKGRKEILDKMLEYISVHYPGSGSIGSLEVLRELF